MTADEVTDYMKRAIELAKKGLGKVSPNPLVGAVIVKNGKVLGEGHHQKYGGPHAEIEALRNIPEGVDLKEATLICNLEPCCHEKKKTPPCTKALIESGVGEVIVANLDPNPEVSGKGLAALEKSGIRTSYGYCQDDGEELNRVFFTFMRKARPFIHLKVAQTLDGKICSSSGDSKWISSEQSRREVHKMRLSYDAVAVGMGTVLSDDPSLTIRMGVENHGKVPRRLIFGNPQHLNTSLKLLNDKNTDRTWIFCKKEDFSHLSQEMKNSLKQRQIQISPVSVGKDQKIDLAEVMEILVKNGVSSILVEGGSQLMSSFIESKFYDRMTLFMAPRLLGNGKGFFQREDPSMENALSMNLRECRQIDQDVVIELENREN